MGGLVIRARLGAARAGLWLAWEMAYWMLVILCRSDHPTRVFITGARQTMKETQLDSLRYTLGPRVCATTKLRIAIVSLVPAALVLPPIWELL